MTKSLLASVVPKRLPPLGLLTRGLPPSSLAPISSVSDVFLASLAGFSPPARGPASTQGHQGVLPAWLTWTLLPLSLLMRNCVSVSVPALVLLTYSNVSSSRLLRHL